MVIEKALRYWLLLLLLATRMCADGQDAVPAVYHLQDFAGNWQVVRNPDSTVTAIEQAMHRDGNQVYSRVLLLKPVVVRAGAAPSDGDSIREFIRQYRPPRIPYTTPTMALETGTQKFNCLEFAEDLVSQAISNGISAQVIGIKFQGRLVGHACAGFPTADGTMLYYDSTPGLGKISERAYQADVQVGEPYHRSDGSELAGGVAKLPIEEIIPVTPLVATADVQPAPQLPVDLSPDTTLMVQTEEHVQSRGILYAEENGFEVSDEQLQRWTVAIAKLTAERARQEEARKKALEETTARLAAKVLQENEELADEGDAYAQMRMGERYLTGDGVKQDPIKGHNYLELAAGQGSPTALEELQRLDHPPELPDANSPGTP